MQGLFGKGGQDAWRKDFEHLGPTEAWCIRIRILQQLCKGSVPCKLDNILLFLALAKCMAFIREQDGDFTAMNDFRSDLVRWQLLFNDELTLLAY